MCILWKLWGREKAHIQYILDSWSLPLWQLFQVFLWCRVAGFYNPERLTGLFLTRRVCISHKSVHSYYFWCSLCSISWKNQPWKNLLLGKMPPLSSLQRSHRTSACFWLCLLGYRTGAIQNPCLMVCCSFSFSLHDALLSAKKKKTKEASKWLRKRFCSPLSLIPFISNHRFCNDTIV